MTATVDGDQGQAALRDLVKQIRDRGSAAYTARDTTVKASTDLAAAGAAAATTGPVDLGTGQTAALEAMAGGGADNTAKYAEATRAIFERGRDRELESGEVWSGDFETRATAVNRDLVTYEEQLIADRDARAAASRRSSGPGDGYVPYGDLESFSPTIGGPTPGTFDAPSQWQEDAMADQDRRADFAKGGPRRDEFVVGRVDSKYPEYIAEADAIMESQFYQGASPWEALQHLSGLVQGMGLSQGDASKLLAEIWGAWEETFMNAAKPQPDSRERVGGGGVQR